MEGQQQRGEEGKEHKDNLSFGRYIRTTFPRANLGDGEGKKERKKEGRKKRPVVEDKSKWKA